MWKRNNPGCRLPLPIGSALFCLWLLAGCAVGPDFVRPQPPAATQLTQGQEPTVTVAADGKAQHFERGAKIAADWWRLFQSPQLDKP